MAVGALVLNEQDLSGNPVRWYVLGVNPEPWAVGPLQTGRRAGKIFATMGRNQQLDAFKEAVREELGEPDLIAPEKLPIRLDIYFWRRQDSYETESGRRHRKHEADLTNMVKACEDALQGVVIHNDRDVRESHCYEVEQASEVTGKIAIRVSVMEYEEIDLPNEVWARLDEIDNPPIVANPNAWPPEEVF